MSSSLENTTTRKVEPSDSALDAARGLLALSVFRHVALALHRAGIRVVPLKGVLLHRIGGERSKTRPLLDVDILVRENDVSRAVHEMAKSGFRQLARTEWAITLGDDAFGMPVDLHWRLFPPGLFRLSAEQLLARCALDTELFGVEVALPTGLDVYAHLVGHFAKGRHSRADTRRLGDFALVSTAYALDPALTAMHILQSGLRRAALYALGEVLAALEDPFAAAVLETLPTDPLGERLATVCRKWLPITGSHTKWLAPHLLNHDIPAALLSSLSHLRRGTTRRLSTSSPHPPPRVSRG